MNQRRLNKKKRGRKRGRDGVKESGANRSPVFVDCKMVRGEGVRNERQALQHRQRSEVTVTLCSDWTIETDPLDTDHHPPSVSRSAAVELIGGALIRWTDGLGTLLWVSGL